MRRADAIATAASVAAVVVLVVFAASVASSARGERALLVSDAALARGDRFGAMLAAREAAEAVTPFGSVARRGHERLDALARDAEGHGDLASVAAARRASEAASREVSGAHANARSHAPAVPTWLFAAVSAVAAACAYAASRFVAARRS